MLISLSKDWLDKNLIEPNEPSCLCGSGTSRKEVNCGLWWHLIDAGQCIQSPSRYGPLRWMDLGHHSGYLVVSALGYQVSYGCLGLVDGFIH